jgi:hypothetical protein
MLTLKLSFVHSAAGVNTPGPADSLGFGGKNKETKKKREEKIIT